MDLGTRIAAWRLWKGWTQAEMADACGFSRPSICQWEKPHKYKSEPSTAAIKAIVDALGITMERFYGRVPKAKRAAA